MPLHPEEYARIKEELETSENPLILHDDDPDGLCSYLLLKRYAKKGKGIMVKPKANVDAEHLKYVEEYAPDKVFIVDIAQVSEEFLRKVNLPVIWIDHHQLQEHLNAQYFNPRKHAQNENEPATYLCYHTVKQDLWIAAVGSVADWQLTDVATAFSSKYPELLSPKITYPGEAIFDSKLGKIIRIFSFIMKGPEEGAYRNIALLEKIESPEELLEGKSEEARAILSYCKPYEEEYEQLIKQALEAPEENDVVIFTYKNRNSFTGELANELLYRRRGKLIVIAREKGEQMRMSLRGDTEHPVLPRLQKAMSMMKTGKGGGHEHACGASIHRDEFTEFIDTFKHID